MYDVAIVGGGPSGMTAALYLRRAGKSVILFEGNVIGGQITQTYEVDNYPGLPHVKGLDFADALLSQIEELGTIVVYSLVDQVKKNNGMFIVSTDDLTYEAKSVVFATGAKHRLLNLPNEKELTGRGISYCAVCDGAFFRDKTVCVVGGGSSAMTDALYLQKIAKKVYVIHHSEKLRSDLSLVEELKKCDNVSFLLNNEVVELIGAKRLEAITIKNVLNNTLSTMAIDGLFIAIGGVPSTKVVCDLLDLPVNYVEANEDGITSIPGVFVAGDCRAKKVRQLTTAISDAANVSSSCLEYLDSISQ